MRAGIIKESVHVLAGIAYLALVPGSASFAAPPEAISPEAARDLQRQKPIAFLDADAAPEVVPDQRTILVFYSQTPVVRTAIAAAEKVANSGGTAKWLTGTPLEWRREGLAIREPEREQPLKLSARQLAAAVKDSTDLQLVDVRSQEAFDDGHVPTARHKMPHEFDAAQPELSKTRWTILIDDGTHVSEQLARDLARKGYALVAWLEGGYPAWVAEPNK